MINVQCEVNTIEAGKKLRSSAEIISYLKPYFDYLVTLKEIHNSKDQDDKNLDKSIEIIYDKSI